MEMKTESLNLEQLQAICEEHGVRGYADLVVNEKGEMRIHNFHFFGLSDSEVKAIRKKYRLGTLKKERRGHDINLASEDITFWGIGECKIIGYDERVVPEHIDKVPIYECEE